MHDGKISYRMANKISQDPTALELITITKSFMEAWFQSLMITVIWMQIWCNEINIKMWVTELTPQMTHTVHLMKCACRLLMFSCSGYIYIYIYISSVLGKPTWFILPHYDDVIMGTIASQITSLTSVYSNVYSGADQSKHQSSASLAFVWGIHRGPVNSLHKWPVTRKMFPFDDVIMHIHQGFFAGPGKIVWVPMYLWKGIKGYG